MAGGSGAPSYTAKTTVNHYASGSWTAGGALTTAVKYATGVGTQTAGLVIGGVTGPDENTSRITTVQEYDGSSWTAAASVNNARNGSGSCGTTALALIYGGRFNSPPNPTNIQAFTETYDGTSWTATGTLNVARDYPGGAGTNNTSALAWAGSPTPGAQATETFTEGATAKTITTS